MLLLILLGCVPGKGPGDKPMAGPEGEAAFAGGGSATTAHGEPCFGGGCGVAELPGTDAGDGRSAGPACFRMAFAKTSTSWSAGVLL